MQWWVSQRVKDAERFVADLELPLPGMAADHSVSEGELERDSQSFMAFASAMGVKPTPARESA